MARARSQKTRWTCWSPWTPGEIVTDVVTLALEGVPPGAYRVAVGWYVGDDRLPAYDPSGARDRMVKIQLKISRGY